MVWSLRAKVRFFALYSRLFIFALQFFANRLISDYETSPQQSSKVPYPSVFKWIPDPPLDRLSPPGRSPQLSLGDEIVSFFLDGFLRWDAQYFLHIANNGYTYENTLSYFPVYPLIVQNFAKLLDNEFFHFSSLLKLSAFVVNLLAFVISADFLYSLSREVLSDEYLAYKSALLYCVNPSGIFFSAPYSESLYALFNFGALYFIESRGIGFVSGIFLALASGTRSNGILNLGFVVYYSMKKVAVETILYVREKKKNLKKSGFYQLQKALNTLAMEVFFPGILNIILCTAPFAAYQWFSFTTYCVKGNIQFSKNILDYGKNLLMPPHVSERDVRFSPWCSYDPPVSYFYVLGKYRGTGLMTYWDLNFLSYFLVAAPAIGIILWQIHNFFLYNKRYSLRLGLIDNALLGIPRLKVLPIISIQTLPRECFIYLIHSMIIVLAGIFFLHIQATTRILCSASPVLFWISAVATTPSQSNLVPIREDENEGDDAISAKVEKPQNLKSLHATILLQEKDCSDLGNWVKLFFLGYTLLGTILFVNNYPWT